MMTTVYAKGDDEIMEVVKRVRDSHHHVLRHAEARFEVLVATDVDQSSGVETGTPAVKLHGYPCYATIKINSLKERVLGRADALITIDGHIWYELDDVGQKALIDHELTHLNVANVDGGLCEWDEEKRVLLGVPKTDDINRPVLKMRRHDWQLGGFREVAQRWGENAIEVRAVRSHLDKKSGQYAWDFAADSHMRKLVTDMIPDDGSITMGSGDQSVTLTSKDKKRLQEAQTV